MALKLTGLAGRGFAGLGQSRSDRAMVRVEVETKNFNRWFQKYVKALPLYHEDLLRKTMFDLIRAMMRNTPVDTGRARMAWGGLHKVHNKRPGTSKAKTATSAAQNQGYAEAKAKDHADARFFAKSNDVYIEVTNPVNYIMYLEAGHSRQSQPGAMIAANPNFSHSGRSWGVTKPAKVKLHSAMLSNPFFGLRKGGFQPCSTSHGRIGNRSGEWVNG